MWCRHAVAEDRRRVSAWADAVYRHAVKIHSAASRPGTRGQPSLCRRSQALWNAFASVHSTLPTSAAAGVASAVFLTKRLGYFPRALQPLSANLLGWTATLLFMFQPLAQLVRLLMDVRQDALYGGSTVIYLCMVKRPFRNPTMAI